ncbi:MAG: PEP/pyruvate-binding domain-containing protein, partial [Candidatus Uhrbacteria bacterium]|nr:PEP/pyruvate-binding domain-containing protein [Candidatus Uhrbacteria bacterium]
IAGGKGASLGEMTQAGIPVPPGFVILADAFEQFLKETDVGVEVNAILRTVDHQKMHTVEDASEKIHALIVNAEMPKDIEEEIWAATPQPPYQGAFRHPPDKGERGGFPVAVRSSATAEDSSAAAWAGQLDSFLNTTEETLIENVKKCWASLFTPRAIFYRFEKGLHEQKISVAVVVQQMIQSEVSGIAFSVHPVTQDQNQLIIEAGIGLGEAIVSGQITPDSYVVEKAGWKILDKNVSEQTRALFVIPAEAGIQSEGMDPRIREDDNPNRWFPLGPEGSQQKLSDQEILELSKLVVNIENHYGFPVDVEWAREGGKFYILQSRPITTLNPS